MARLARGHEVLEKAKSLLSKVKDIDEMRMLQAVVLPLTHGMSTEETADVIGRSSRWTTKIRNDFIRHAGLPEKPQNKIRNRARMSVVEESAFLEPFFEQASKGGILVVSGIHKELEKHLNRKVCLASVYKVLHRHGWRKLAPDKRNVATDIQAQEDWKKNCQNTSRKSRKSGKEKAK
jgi:transposase